MFLETPELTNNIKTQFLNICSQTIIATQNEFRAMNRGIKNNAVFNLVAYDTLLDDSNILHLIEINRGADLVGLQKISGEIILRFFKSSLNAFV